MQIDHHGIPNIGNTGGGAGGSSTNNSGMHTSMTSSLHRRSLQDVDALGLFHHGRGLGRHLSRQSSDDSRRRSSANLQNLAGSVTHLAGSMTGRTAIIFFPIHTCISYPKIVLFMLCIVAKFLHVLTTVRRCSTTYQKAA